MDLSRYIVLRYGAYITVITVFVLATFTFNLVRGETGPVCLRRKHPAPN